MCPAKAHGQVWIQKSHAFQRRVWDIARRLGNCMLEANQGGSQTDDYHFAAILLILENYFSYTQSAILTLVCCFN